jgi:fermentation-respiration switch protein FrsA (DUF1100 family)
VTPRAVVKIILTALIVIAALVVMVRALESRIAFFPFVGETVTPERLGVPYDSVSLPTADGVNLRAWSLPHSSPRATVLYFHGNGGNLSMWAPILVGIQQQGYAVRAFDYRGYGMSTGRPSERGLYTDVDAAVEWAWSAHDARLPMIYWGRSLGTTMAAYAASRRPPRALILEAGFPDARTVLRSSPLLALLGVFSSYRFPTARWLDEVRCPVLVMHGDADQIIPFDAGRALFEKIAGPKQFVSIRGGDHNDAEAPDPGAYWSAVNAFITSLRRM